MKYSVLSLVICLFILWGCKPEEPLTEEPATPSGTLTLQNGTYSQLELAQIDVSNVTLNATSYSGQIGSETVHVGTLVDQLFFVVPDISAGQYDINLTIEGHDYSVPITITETILPTDVNGYISTQRDVIFDITGVSDDLSSVSNISNPTEDANNISTYTDVRNDFDAEVANLSAADQSLLAKYLKANESTFNSVLTINPKDSLNINRGGIGTYYNNLDSDVQDLIVVGSSAALTLGGIMVAYQACPVTVGWSCVAGLAATGVGIKLLLKYKAKVGNISDKTWTLIETNLANFFNRSTLQKDETYGIQVQGNRRTFYSEDAHSPNALVQSFWAVSDKGEDLWDGLKTVVNNIASIFSANYTINGVFPHPRHKTTYTSQWLNEKADYLTVTNISNPNVTVASQSKVDGEIRIVFTTNATTDQTFGFDLVYDDGEYEHIETVWNLVLSVSPCQESDLIGTWTMQDYYDDGSAAPYYWTYQIYNDGTLTFTDSNGGAPNNASYSFSNCNFSYDFLGCQHNFTLTSGTNTYTAAGCGGFSHHIYTKQ